MDWKKLVVSEGITVKETLKKMDAGGERIIFVADKNNLLKGVVTDGDVRRYYLAKGNLDGFVSEVLNPDPSYVNEGCDKEEVMRVMKENQYEVVPVVDDNMHLINAYSWIDFFGEQRNIEEDKKISLSVVVMAGGKGDRLYPFTKIFPKALFPVGEKPIVELILDRFRQYGVKDFYLTLNYKGEMIKSYFDNLKKNYSLSYIWEKEYLGTAGSLQYLPDDIGETFIVSNGDILVKIDYSDFLEFHNQNQNLLTIVGTIQHYKIPYGIIHFKNDGKISEVQEKPEIDFTVNSGVYLLSKKVLKYIPKDKPFDMTDLVRVLLEEGKSVGVYPVSQKSYADIGQWDEYKKVVDRLSL